MEWSPRVSTARSAPTPMSVDGSRRLSSGSVTTQDVADFLAQHYMQGFFGKRVAYGKAALVVHPDKVLAKMPPKMRAQVHATPSLSRYIHDVTSKVLALYDRSRGALEGHVLLGAVAAVR